MKFIDNEHKRFYEQMVSTISPVDDHRKAMFYTLGLTDTTRRNINDIYDFAEHRPRFSAIRCGWQTGPSIRVTRLAFNLYNGYDGKGRTDMHSAYTPYALFGCGLMEYMIEAARLLYSA